MSACEHKGAKACPYNDAEFIQTNWPVTLKPAEAAKLAPEPEPEAELITGYPTWREMQAEYGLPTLLPEQGYDHEEDTLVSEIIAAAFFGGPR
jgi:hypothetical protein